MQNTEDLTVEIKDYVARVTMSAAPVNAVSRAMRERLVTAFDTLSERKDVRVVILRSSLKSFCAGVDLKDRPDPMVEGALPMTNRLTRETFNAVRECAKPVIAAVNGPALGFGLALVAACDILVAADDAWVSMPEINVGLAGGGAMLQELLPRSLARRLFFTGDRITTAELGRMGVLECVASDQLAQRVDAIAVQLAGTSPQALRYAKRSLNTAELMPQGEAYKLEQHYTTLLAASPDGVEARQAYLEKRMPVFRQD